MKFKQLICPLLVVALGAVSVSCSDDDEKDNPGGGASIDLPIPSSVVDGVRVSEINGVADIDYNADGSVNSAVYDGQKFNFEYEGSRAYVSTGRKLVRIVSAYDGASWEATDFRFNDNGFITGYKEKSEYSEDGWWEKAYLDINISYNAQGRISEMNVSGKTEGYDEDGKYSDGAKGTVKYSYENGCLKQSVLKTNWIENSYTYGYDKSATNKYNISTPHLAAGIGNFSPIGALFAFMGYLGNASAELPTHMVYSYKDYEDPENNETENYGFSYTFDDLVRISSITTSSPYGNYTIGITYIVQK